ncbi:UNVERIFIED_CONTAM: hypothetical protein Sradi_0762700 [Sesamum radiatum]|uniref:RING-CH-type domain-containing protein n=1 Tax=Sesamum radiatum TaxID=300843 RepID=A0AAW2VPE7_SESRA
MDLNLGSSPGKLADCRICHDEDEDSNMEIPCSCRGSLKGNFLIKITSVRKCGAMRKVTLSARFVIRFNLKISLRIVYLLEGIFLHHAFIFNLRLQQFKPGYTAPTPLFHYGGAPMNFRGNWAISRSDMHDSELAEMVSTEENFLDSNFDEYPIPTSRGLICCRIVAVILMVLLVLRHTLPFIIYGAGESSISLFTVSLSLRLTYIDQEQSLTHIFATAATDVAYGWNSFAHLYHGKGIDGHTTQAKPTGYYDTIDISTQRRFHDRKIGILACDTASNPCMLHHLAWRQRNAFRSRSRIKRYDTLPQ